MKSGALSQSLGVWLQRTNAVSHVLRVAGDELRRICAEGSHTGAACRVRTTL